MQKYLVNDKKLVIPLLGAPGVQLSNTTLKENLTNAEIQFKSLFLLQQRFKPDGIFNFMDLTVEAEALGLKVLFPENESPSIKEHSVKTLEDLKNVKNNWKGLSWRMNVFIDTMKKMSQNLDMLKGGYVIGPYTLAGELMEVNDLVINTILEPELVHEFLDFAVDVISVYANALFDAGADTVVVLEPTAMMISPDQFEEFSLKPFKKLLKNVDNKPLIFHICGNTSHLIGHMSNSGAVGLSLDSVLDFKKIAPKVPEDVLLIGNLDPVTVFMNSTVDEVMSATRKLKEDMKNVKNFVLSSGCDIPIGTPLENIDAFMKAARE